MATQGIARESPDAQLRYEDLPRDQRLEVGKPLALTQREIEELCREYGEYSCSIPTGTTIGKRWMCNANAYTPGAEDDWYLCEYVSDPDPKMVGIRTYHVVIDEPMTAAETEQALKMGEHP